MRVALRRLSASAGFAPTRSVHAQNPHASVYDFFVMYALRELTFGPQDGDRPRQGDDQYLPFDARESEAICAC
jgi:hypothetical protein